jgi:hypothetical protein
VSLGVLDVLRHRRKAGTAAGFDLFLPLARQHGEESMGNVVVDTASLNRVATTTTPASGIRVSASTTQPSIGSPM